MNFEELLQTKDYDFLRTNPRLSGRIMLLGLSGSYGYGTNREGSDVDFRGVALNSKAELLGLSHFEQFENRATDTVIYSVGKLFSLLLNCNPNIIEMLGLREQDYAYISPEGKMLLGNRELFLSKKAANSFGGYANAQLRRIQTATARDRLPELQKQKFIAGSMENAIVNMANVQHLDDFGTISLRVDEEKETIMADLAYKDLPLPNLIDMINTLKQVRDEYAKTAGNRNHKKDDAALCKHAMHLVRLYRMGIQILAGDGIQTYRGDDHDLLMSIRSGAYMQKDGTFSEDFYRMVSELEARLQELKETSPLPAKPDMKKIEELLISINENS